LIGDLDCENQNVQLEICIVYSETGPKDEFSSGKRICRVWIGSKNMKLTAWWVYFFQSGVR